MAYNQWEQKQLLDLTAKSINSLLINVAHKPSHDELLEEGDFFLKFYANLLNQLKELKIKEVAKKDYKSAPLNYMDLEEGEDGG